MTVRVDALKRYENGNQRYQAALLWMVCCLQIEICSEILIRHTGEFKYGNNKIFRVKIRIFNLIEEVDIAREFFKD